MQNAYNAHVFKELLWSVIVVFTVIHIYIFILYMLYPCTIFYYLLQTEFNAVYYTNVLVSGLYDVSLTINNRHGI